MKTALIHDWLTGMRGGEKVLESLGSMFPDAPIHTLFYFPGSVSESIAAHPIKASYLQRYPGVRKHYRRYLPLFPAAIEDFDLSSYELLISSSHCVAKGAIPGPGAIHVCYCHTPVRYAWDQESVYFPKRTGLVARLRGLILSRLRSWDVETAQRVDRFVANSSFVAGRIRRYYGREADVVPPPVDTDFYRPGARRAGGFCLAVSALAPYKRVEIAVEACRQISRPLVVVGEGPERERLERLAGPDTKFVGRVDADRLRQLFRDADCFLQPGVEDFGISTVEALACGCPVVALEKGGVLDIVEAGEHGILYTGEGEPEPMAAAIDKCLQIRFNELNLRQRAEHFSAPLFVERMHSLIESAVKGLGTAL